MLDQTLLILGCEKGFLDKFSLLNPASPQLVTSIQLQDDVYTFLKFSERILLCGQNKGFIDVVDVYTFKSINQLYIQGSSYINDMTRTAEKEVIAVACGQGLWIVKFDKELTMSSSHLKGKWIQSVCHVRQGQVILGVWNLRDFIIFDYMKDEERNRIPNPSGDFNPYRIIALNDSRGCTNKVYE